MKQWVRSFALALLCVGTALILSHAYLWGWFHHPMITAGVLAAALVGVVTFIFHTLRLPKPPEE